MNAFFARPGVQKTLRYSAAYALYVFFVLLALAITWSLRSNIIFLAAALGVSAHYAYILSSWGTGLIFIPFIFFLGFMEHYMNTAARNRQVWPRARKVLLIEGGVGLISLLIMLLSVLFQSPGG